MVIVALCPVTGAALNQSICAGVQLERGIDVGDGLIVLAVQVAVLRAGDVQVGVGLEAKRGGIVGNGIVALASRVIALLEGVRDQSLGEISAAAPRQCQDAIRG